MKIIELKIYCLNLTKQIDFYSQKLGLKLIEKTDFNAKFNIGKSKLELIKSNEFKPYHFAINIPCNKENQALKWLKKRVEILKVNDNEIQYFNDWNASAIYFYDQDKNIVELIARQTLENESQEDFDKNSLLEISEIGVPVNNIKETFNILNDISSIEKYRGEFEKFCAIGNETGLFICINKNIKNWFPTEDIANSSEFEIQFEEKKSQYQIEFKNGKIKALANNG